MQRKEPCEIYAAHKPHKGDTIVYKGKPIGRVTSVEGGLCWHDYFGAHDPLPFVWCFRDGLNNLHDWPAKTNPRDR